MISDSINDYICVIRLCREYLLIIMFHILIQHHIIFGKRGRIIYKDCSFTIYSFHTVYSYAFDGIYITYIITEKLSLPDVSKVFSLIGKLDSVAFFCQYQEMTICTVFAAVPDKILVRLREGGIQIYYTTLGAWSTIHVRLSFRN